MSLSSLLARSLACLALFVTGLPAWAINSYYVQFADIKGESADREHPKWTELTSFAWGINNSGVIGGGGGGAGKATAMDFSWTQTFDASTIPLMAASGKGKHLDKVTFDVENALGKRFFQMIFTESLVTSIGVSGSGDAIGVSGSLNFAKVVLNYWQIDSKGALASTPITATLDFASNVFDGDAQAFTGLFLAGGKVSIEGGLPLSPVPEPGSALLLAAGLGLLAQRRFRNAASAASSASSAAA